MILFIFLFIFICFYGMKVSNSFLLPEQYLSKESVNAIKGLCAVGVMLQHITLSLEKPGIMFPFGYVGFLYVSLFFFFSAYGLSQGILKKKNYFSHFWERRLKKVYIPMVSVNILYTLWYYFIIQTKEISIINITKDLLGITLINGTEWYILSILFFYLIFFLSFQIENKKVACYIVLLLTIIYAYICYWFHMDIKWYKSCFAFPLGLFLALYKERILKEWKQHFKIWKLAAFSGIFLEGGVLAYQLVNGENMNVGYMILLQIIISILFVICYLLLSLKVIIYNKILNFLGEISFDIYLIHEFFIICCRNEKFYIKVDFIYFGTVLGLTIIFSTFWRKIIYENWKKGFVIRKIKT